MRRTMCPYYFANFQNAFSAFGASSASNSFHLPGELQSRHSTCVTLARLTPK